MENELERLDRLIARSEGIDPADFTFAFRPLWQLDAPAKAALALAKAQTTQIYAGLNLWPAAVTAKLVEAQLAEGGTYPNAAQVFAEVEKEAAVGFPALGNRVAQISIEDFFLAQPRGPDGRWISGGTTKQNFPLGNSPSLMKVAEADPPLRRIHPDSTYETDPKSRRSLDHWRNQSTDDIVRSFADIPDQPLLVTPDGRLMNGNTRTKVLQERGYPIDGLPRTLHPDPFDNVGGGGSGRIPLDKPVLE